MKIASRSRSSRPGQYPVATIAAFQAPMPAQQRRWRDDERLPTGARQKSAGGAEKQAVNRGDRRPPRAPGKDCEFVPQYDDLEVLELRRHPGFCTLHRSDCGSAEVLVG